MFVYITQQHIIQQVGPAHRSCKENSLADDDGEEKTEELQHCSLSLRSWRLWAVTICLLHLWGHHFRPQSALLRSISALLQTADPGQKPGMQHYGNCSSGRTQTIQCSMATVPWLPRTGSSHHRLHPAKKDTENRIGIGETKSLPYTTLVQAGDVAWTGLEEGGRGHLVRRRCRLIAFICSHSYRTPGLCCRVQSTPSEWPAVAGLRRGRTRRTALNAGRLPREYRRATSGRYAVCA